MATNVSPLLPTSQSDLSGASTWPFASAETQSTHNNSYDLLMPRLSEPAQRNYSTSAAPSIAYELSHIDSTSAKKTTTTSSPGALRASLASWSLEIGAMLISLVSIIAIISLLNQENGNSLDRWPLAVSLNTVVSTLGTLARVTLAFALSACVGQQKWNWLYKRSDRLVAFERFDEAAKGPWGGARLFIWLKARHWAALGALVIVGTIALDPFLQAVITVQGRLDNYSRSLDAAIGFARDIRGGIFNFKTNKGNIPPGRRNMSSFMEISERPDFGIVSAMYNGFRNPSIALQEHTSFVCATGNCTWPLFSSAAVCSSCADVSSSLESSAEFGVNGVSVPWGLGEDYEGDYTIWSLPTANIRNYNKQFNRTDIENPATLLILNSTNLAGNTIAHRNHEALLMAFTTIRASEEFQDKNALWNETTPIATECALYLCAQAYQAVSVNNVLQEHVVGSWSNREPWSYAFDYSYYTVPVNETLAKETADELGNNLLDRTDLHHDLQLVIPYEGLPNALSMNRRFNVSQAFIITTMTWLDQFITKAGGESGTGKGPWRGANNVGYPGGISPQPLIIDALWNSTNLTLTFDNVARSLTNQIRNTSSQKQDGVLQRWTIHVQVNWWYLLFPITMLTTGFIYVSMVIVESTRLRLPVWKESARPTLLYGFSDESQRLLREEIDSKKPVASVRYQVGEKDDCLRLVADHRV